MELIRLNRRELVVYPFAWLSRAHCGAGSEHIRLGYHELVVGNIQLSDRELVVEHTHLDSRKPVIIVHSCGHAAWVLRRGSRAEPVS